ncbi:hypothetical protein AX14_004846 [Amanita brunnescens Koide BX004]|nr:hypothetical protein AX14_004846 [Amanita brunnescens Koide BX004]
MASGSKRIRKPTHKAAAILEEQTWKNPKSKRKRTQKKTIQDTENDDSDSSESSEEPRHYKRCRQPDPEEIELLNDPSDGEPEEVQVNEDSGVEEIDVEVNDSEGLDNDVAKKGEDNDTQPIGSMNNGLKEKHHADILHGKNIKTDTTRDLCLDFSEQLSVTFNTGGSKETVEGRWCEICRKDPKIVHNKSFQKAFLVGSNTTCRGHIHQHYEFYSKKCKEQGLKESEHCVPPEILRARKSKSNVLIQSKLTVAVGTERAPKQFTREGLLRTVTKFVACDNQAFEVANKAVFRNCLTSMRPQTIKQDLPTAHLVKTELHNAFSQHLNELKAIITSLPGKVSITVDGWTADSTKLGFIGITAHWIRVMDKGEWVLDARVIALRGLSGDHGGKNLGRYIIGLCDHMGLIGNEKSKLYGATLDNTSANGVICKTISRIHSHRKLEAWDHRKQQYMCLEHVINLANIDVMKHITKIAVVETKTAIWEYDPSDPSNRISNGGLDVIATIRTLAIKIQASGTRIEKFNQLQVQTGIQTPLKIPLHSNVQWGTAFAMLDRSLTLQNAITLFINCADGLFGPITTIQRDGRVKKEIRWTAFMLSADDWQRVSDADICTHAGLNMRTPTGCSIALSEKKATLWRVLPLIEDLQTCWEKKQDSTRGVERFAIYRNAIQDGLDKLKKYYNQFDEKPAYILALILHPYYKLDYIKMAWGGEKEQGKQQEAGNVDAKNWQDEALRIFEQTVEAYWKTQPQASESSTNQDPSSASRSQNNDHLTSEYDQHCLSLLKEGNCSETWGSEVRCYLKDIEADVKKDMDIIKWWQDHNRIYLMLAQIALDILPCQASSVPCEHLFLSSKQVATECRSRLGSDLFKQIVMMKSAWQGTVVNWATVNSQMAEEVILTEYGDLLQAENDAKQWDEEDDIFVLSDLLDENLSD